MEKINLILSSSVPPDYSLKDENLLLISNLDKTFGDDKDYIENFIYNNNDELIIGDLNYTNYKIQNNNLTNPTNNLTNGLYIDPIFDLKSLGLIKGIFKSQYNFYRKFFNSDFNNSFIIKEISSDRTELKLINLFISNEEIENSINLFKQNNTDYYKDFLLNFNNNEQLIGVNIDLDKNNENYIILIKLYEPLPLKYIVNSTLSLVEELSEPYLYEISFINNIENDEYIPLKGPNFSVLTNEINNSSTNYLNYNDLFSTTITSSYQQLYSILEEKGIHINIDYSNYSNFIHFGSAKERLLNFLYKLKLIEGYNNNINSLNNISGSTSGSFYVSSSKAINENKINELIFQFDGYEKFLYFESGSKSWPKQNNNKPYILQPTTSSASIAWFGNDIDSLNNTNYGGQLLSASIYDKNNQNNLINLVPEYIREDDQNQSYLLFVNMVGQYFDNLWTYSKAITDINDADNRLNKGISKDLVADVLKSFGIKIYNNNYVNNGLFEYILGITNSGSYLPSSSSFETLVTASVSGSSFESFTTEDINKEVLKRIYHNLPYLLKTKGTERGLKALLACYGIPSTILRINEFGSNDKLDSTEDFYYDKYFYGVHLKGQDSFIARWKPLLANSMSYGEKDTVPDTIEFRFNTLGLIPSNTYTTQSLFQVFNGGANKTHFGVRLTYPQSSSGSYKKYGNISLVMSGAFGYYTSTPIYLPVFDGNWWNVMIKRENHLVHSNSASNNTYSLYIKNSIYNGHDGNQIGFQGSSSILVDGSTSSSYNNSWHDEIPSVRAYLGYNPNGGIIASNNSYFTGSFQELRYWSTPLSENAFNKHVLNPESIEGDSISASYYFLNARYPLGTNLKTYNHYNIPGVESVHPNQLTQSFIITSGPSISYSSYMTASFATSSINSYLSFTQKYYFNNPNVGLLTRVNDKIRIISSSIITGSIYSSSFWNYNLTTESVLSPYNSIEEKLNYYNTDSNIIEVNFSPQDEINDDIIQQLGFFNIDEYIGDPRQQTGSIYPDLETLKNFYFQKYSSSYNLYDYIRLIKYFDNSLFKIIKDFTPARSNTTTGITIKPHILERNRIPLLPITFSQSLYTSSIDVGEYSGSSGGYYELNHDTNYTESIKTIYGNTDIIHNFDEEFYYGVLNGSTIKVTDQSLNNNPFVLSQPEILYDYIHTTSSIYFDATNPTSGQLILYNSESILAGAYQAYSVKIHNTSKNNISLKDTLPYLNKIKLTYTESISTGIFNITEPTLEFEEKYSLTPDIFYYKVKFSDYYTNINTGSAWTNPDRITLFYPYYPKNFVRSEYDILAGYASESIKSNIYQKVDYITNQQNPINFNRILLGSASKAEIIDGNYNYLRHINPRYKGTVYGLFSSNNIINRFYPLGKKGLRPINIGAKSIDNNKSYFGYFTSLVLQAPDYGTYIAVDNNYTKGYLKYLIDLEGNIIELEGTTNYNLEMVQNLFKDGNNIRVSLNDPYYGGIDMTSITGLKEIKFGGKVPRVIWYTQTGSSAKSSIPYKVDTNNDGIYDLFPTYTSANSWGTGSTGSRLLTASANMEFIFSSQYYGGWKIRQLDWNDAEFDTITLDFNILAGDQIRFSNNEVNTYTIVNVIPSGSPSSTTGSLVLELDRTISGSFNTGIFVLRRIVNNESMFILNASKPSGETSDGFIYPETMEPDLDKNISNIIESLYNRGILVKN